MLACVVVYIAFVFRKLGRTTSPWVMGLAAIVALVHDVAIPVGVFAVLGHFYGIEVTGVFVAAALTILGFQYRIPSLFLTEFAKTLFAEACLPAGREQI